jgi:hypothetical protein
METAAEAPTLEFRFVSEVRGQDKKVNVSIGAGYTL